jgi:hypothetical protein
VPGGVGNLSSVEEGLCWNTPDVKAGAANFVFLNESNAHPELTGTKSGRIAATSCAKDDQIKSVLSHE